MTSLANRRSAILLFSLSDCLHSHRTRLVIKEKIKMYFLEILPLISENFFMSEVFGLVDCSLAPLLWRMKHLGVEIPENQKIIRQWIRPLPRKPTKRKP